MWRSAFLAVLTLFLCCSWFWTVGLPVVKSPETITTNVQLNLIQQSVMAHSNSSVEGWSRKGNRENRRFENQKQQVPKYMLDLYKKYNADNYSGRRSTLADIVRSVTPISTASLRPWGQSFHETSRRHLLIFDVPVSKKGETLEIAELKVSANTRNVLNAYTVDADDVQITAGPKLFASDGDFWSTFHVSQFLVDHNVDSRRTPIKFIVHTSDNNLLDDDELQSMLILSYSTTSRGPPSRRKRSLEAEDYEEESNNLWDDDMVTAPRATTSNPVARRARRLRNTCRRRPLYVDFSEIHYDSWIVAPNGYEAFQCLGKCFFPVSEHLSPTKHAIVQTLVHAATPGKVPRACCVPTRLEPISVLYVDQRGVLTYRFSYQDMVVAECGCR